MNQRTIQKNATVKGVGLHTGLQVTMTFCPADVNHGIRFKRTDLEGTPVIKADISKVIDTNRGTTVGRGEATVSTIEHALSALVGLQIDNILIEIDGPEVPIMDGSAIEFVEALETAGIQEQEAARDPFIIEEPISFKDEETGTEIYAFPADDYHITAMIDFGSEVVGKQFAQLDHIDKYKAEIAPCRTFVFLHELEMLADQGLVKGGDLENAVVIANRAMEKSALDQLAQKLGHPSMEVNGSGVLNTTELRFVNEPARHKLLDIIGDLALLGVPIVGKIVAYKPGHKSNVAFAQLLKEKLQAQRKLKGKPKYDPTQEPVMDSVKIAEFLPHRYPFLLVDKIIELSETRVVGVKNVTFNEAFFQGHFPNNPVFPGVLQMEALAQTGGILALANQEDPGNWDTYFLKIDNAKFKSMVVPGDTILLKMELLGPIRRGIVQMYGTAYVGNRIVSEGELTAQIVRRKN